jgi:hypothetical protein
VLDRPEGARHWQAKLLDSVKAASCIIYTPFILAVTDLIVAFVFRLNILEAGLKDSGVVEDGMHDAANASSSILPRLESFFLGRRNLPRATSVRIHAHIQPGDDLRSPRLDSTDEHTKISF